MIKTIEQIDREIKDLRRDAFNSPFSNQEQKLEAIKLIKELKQKRLDLIAKK